jgi:hypothetical protein
MPLWHPGAKSRRGARFVPDGTGPGGWRGPDRVLHALGMGITVDLGNEILRDNFAPWVLDLGLTVEQVGERSAVLRLPWSDRLARQGAALAGQAMAAAADTATVIAVAAALGGYRNVG